MKAERGARALPGIVASTLFVGLILVLSMLSGVDEQVLGLLDGIHAQGSWGPDRVPAASCCGTRG